MSLAEFVDSPDEILKSWPREPLRFRRDPDAFRSYLSLDEVNVLIGSDCLAMRNVVLLKDGEITERWRYVDPEDSAMPRRGAIREHIDAGGSISLRELARLKPALADLRQRLRDETGYGVHINGYLTPPGCQGLKYHFDPYVTLILQIAGRKTWPAHRPFFDKPVQEYGSFHLTGFTDEQLHYLANTPPEMAFTLEPGDVLWLPRGYVHSPYTEGDETSLHLTVAFKERTWHWLAEQVARQILDRALTEPSMREELAPELIATGAPELVQEIRDYLIGSLLLMNADDAIGHVRDAVRR